MLCGFTVEAGTLDGGGTQRWRRWRRSSTGADRAAGLDRTGLPGSYDVALKWTPSLGTDAQPADAVSIFTAVQEQLGLKLDSGTAPLDVVVIDRIERPTEN